MGHKGGNNGNMFPATLRFWQPLLASQLKQSVANNFFDEQILIWILLARNIIYKYKYEYYS
jgi:hypothetical protein